MSAPKLAQPQWLKDFAAELDKSIALPSVPSNLRSFGNYYTMPKLKP